MTGLSLAATQHQARGAGHNHFKRLFQGISDACVTNYLTVTLALRN
jgi:hypothetical protein